LSRRAERLEAPKPSPSARDPVHLLVDSTGLRLCGPGEWLVEKHGTRTRRSWRKLHIGVDAETGQILAAEPTTSEAAISWLQRVIGDALRSRTDRHRLTEMVIAIAALNRMLELGRPKSVRIT
jgi:hypothetical protein